MLEIVKDVLWLLFENGAAYLRYQDHGEWVLVPFPMTVAVTLETSIRKERETKVPVVATTSYMSFGCTHAGQFSPMFCTCSSNCSCRTAFNGCVKSTPYITTDNGYLYSPEGRSGWASAEFDPDPGISEAL